MTNFYRNNPIKIKEIQKENESFKVLLCGNNKNNGYHEVIVYHNDYPIIVGFCFTKKYSQDIYNSWIDFITNYKINDILKSLFFIQNYRNFYSYLYN